MNEHTKNMDEVLPIEKRSEQAAHLLEEVLSDPSLTIGEKRATLASWASDARALKDVPSLRKLENGVVIRLEDIFQSLRKLDDDDDPPPSPAAMNIPVPDFSSLAPAA